MLPGEFSALEQSKSSFNLQLPGVFLPLFFYTLPRQRVEGKQLVGGADGAGLEGGRGLLPLPVFCCTSALLRCPANLASPRWLMGSCAAPPQHLCPAHGASIGRATAASQEQRWRFAEGEVMLVKRIPDIKMVIFHYFSLAAGGFSASHLEGM